MKDLFQITFTTTAKVETAYLPKISRGITSRLERLADALLPVLEKEVKDYIVGKEEPTAKQNK